MRTCSTVKPFGASLELTVVRSMSSHVLDQVDCITEDRPLPSSLDHATMRNISVGLRSQPSEDASVGGEDDGDDHRCKCPRGWYRQGHGCNRLQLLSGRGTARL